MTRARFADTLQLLAGHNVEFIVVGMTAGILQGVPLTTIDVDILHRRTPANVEKLLGALTQMQAQYRHDPRKLSPTASHLIGPGTVSYTHLRAHETDSYLVCRLLLEKKK